MSSKLGKHARSEVAKADSKSVKHAVDQRPSNTEVISTAWEDNDHVPTIAFNPRSGTLMDLCSDPVTNAMDKVWNQYGVVKHEDRLEKVVKRIRNNIEKRIDVSVNVNDDKERYKNSEAIVKVTIRPEYTFDGQVHPCQFNINESQVCAASGLMGFGNAGEMAKDLEQRKFSVSLGLGPCKRDVSKLHEINVLLKTEEDIEKQVKLAYERDQLRAKIRKSCITDVCYRMLLDHALFQMYLSPLVALQRFPTYQYDKFYSGSRKKLWKRYYEGDKEPIDAGEDADPMRAVIYKDEHGTVVDWRHPVVAPSLYLQFLSRMQKSPSDAWYFLTKVPLYAWEKDRKGKSDKKKSGESEPRPTFCDWRQLTNHKINAFRVGRNVFLKKSRSTSVDSSAADGGLSSAAVMSDAGSGFNMNKVGVRQFDFPYEERDAAKRTEFYKSRLLMAEKMGLEVNPIKYALQQTPAPDDRIPPQAPFLTTNCTVSCNVVFNCLALSTQFVVASFSLFGRINVHVWQKADSEAVLYMKTDDGDVDNIPMFSEYGCAIVSSAVERPIAAGSDTTGMD